MCHSNLAVIMCNIFLSGAVTFVTLSMYKNNVSETVADTCILGNLFFHTHRLDTFMTKEHLKRGTFTFDALMYIMCIAIKNYFLSWKLLRYSKIANLDFFLFL